VTATVTSARAETRFSLWECRVLGKGKEKVEREKEKKRSKKAGFEPASDTFFQKSTENCSRRGFALEIRRIIFANHAGRAGDRSAWSTGAIGKWFIKCVTEEIQRRG